MSQEEVQSAYKYLKLIGPSDAQKYGVAAEAPVFISPMVNATDCTTCGIHYTPLVYQTGYMTKSQHFHRGGFGGGGIYITHKEDLPTGQFWVATVGLVGKLDLIRERVEAVTLHSIKAKCACHGEGLDQGLAILTQDHELQGYEMRPVCCEYTEEYFKFRGCFDKWHFQIRDGVVSFRPV